MSITHAIATTWRNGSNTLSATLTKTSTGEDNHSVDLTSSEANHQVLAAFTTSNLKSIYVYCPNAAITLYTNSPSGSSPADTIVIPLGVPFIWQSGSGVVCPFVGASGSVTSLYLTSGTAVACTVEIRILKAG